MSTTAPINNDARWPAAAAAALVLHINRETLHHGAEIALLRDLCRWQLKEGGLIRRSSAVWADAAHAKQPA